MTARIKSLFSFLLFISILFYTTPYKTAAAADLLPFIILSQYQATMNIHDELYLIAITSNLKMPTFKSSNSSVAAVDTYGKITAKKEGTATITAKIKNAEASCKVTVRKTTISLNKSSATLERGQSLKLTATTSNGSPVKWKSSKSSIATIDENGLVTAQKPGETTITVSADGYKATCKITVKTPEVKLNKTKVTLYRNQTVKLLATVSSGIKPTWKTNKKSVAIVEEDGTVTALKHGSAVITATVDGVTARCEIIVKQPTITLSSTELHIKKGEQTRLSAIVSSGNIPTWSSSNSNIATVDDYGNITALQKGRAYIYAAEDGVKVRCTVYVTE